MDGTLLVTILAGVTVALLFGGVALLLSKSPKDHAEDRLEELTSGRRAQQQRQAKRNAEALLRPRSGGDPALSQLGGVFNGEAIRRLYEQADVDLELRSFILMAGALAAVGGLVSILLLPIYVAPLGVATLGALPFLFLMYRKGRRIASFMESMPDAVELMGRALRAGHGLASGMQLVSQEMKGPIASEFGRVFEEQNLGVSLEEALRGMAERVPTMDVRFLVTAIIIQRTTGGDLAEVLDKIGRLIRQRFELLGHVKALTAEGRLSGIVLLALPPGLLAFLLVTNYPYVAPMFETPLGTKMLGVTAVLQVVGAMAIKKIVAIKV